MECVKQFVVFGTCEAKCGSSGEKHNMTMLNADTRSLFPKEIWRL